MPLSQSFALCLVSFLCLIALARARQHYRSRIPNGNVVRCPAGDPHCDEGDVCEGVGHESCAGGVVTPKLNPFGRDLKAAGVKWTKELCEKDSDGDGFSNGHELGDPCCIWTEGAASPQWMLDWPVSHPGVTHSKQVPDQDLDELCKSAQPLKEVEFYNEGEEQVTLDFPMLPQTIPPQETTYVDYRVNLPEDKKYYMVGAEAILDNEEMVHHFTVRSCNITVEKPGVIVNDTMNPDCLDYIFVWALGAEAYVLPLNVAIPIGQGTGRISLHLQVHYDNPLFKEGETDASGIRIHATTTPRDFEAGLLITGTQIDIGRLPPKTKSYSSTVFQIKVDEEVAPDGVTVFTFFPHMHFTGRRLVTEKLQTNPDRRQPVTSLNLGDLEKDEDIGRDDDWSYDGQTYFRINPVKLRDGDYLATSCLYDTEDREGMTVGGLGSRDEMCFGILTYYPEKAIKGDRLLKGPSYVGQLNDAQFKSIPSVIDILRLPSVNAGFPAWRRGYLDGGLVCEGGALESDNVDMSSDLIAACGVQLGVMFLSGIGNIKDLGCSNECAKVAYNSMGCFLVKHAIKDGNIVYPLHPLLMEHTVEKQCGKTFVDIYGAKLGAKSEDTKGRRLLIAH